MAQESTRTSDHTVLRFGGKALLLSLAKEHLIGDASVKIVRLPPVERRSGEDRAGWMLRAFLHPRVRLVYSGSEADVVSSIKSRDYFMRRYLTGFPV